LDIIRNTIGIIAECGFTRNIVGLDAFLRCLRSWCWCLVAIVVSKA
jgi:hypothetical protein